MRKLQSWLAGFMEYTDGIVSPEIMRIWAAVAAVNAAMGGRTHTYIQGQILYPNLFLMLVGPPGIGKSNASKFAKRIIRASKATNLAPDALTRRVLYQELERVTKAEDPKKPLALSSELFALIEEFGVFLNPYDTDFMRHLAHMFDNPEIVDYKTAHVGSHHLENVFFNMTGCCTLDYIKDAYNTSAIESGFPARIILIYSHERVKKSLFEEDEIAAKIIEERKGLGDALAEDLAAIAKLKGRFIWDQGAKEEISKWYDGGMQPAPVDRRLEHYNTRRLVMFTKTTMAIAAARGSDLVVLDKDFLAAKELLEQTELSMPTVMEVLGKSGVQEEIQTCIRIVQTQFLRTKKPVPEFRLRQFLMREVPPHLIDSLINAIIHSTEIQTVGLENSPGRRQFIPAQRGEEK